MEGDGFLSAAEIEGVVDFDAAGIGEFGIGEWFFLDFEGGWYCICSWPRDLYESWGYILCLFETEILKAGLE